MFALTKFILGTHALVSTVTAALDTPTAVPLTFDSTRHTKASQPSHACCNGPIGLATGTHEGPHHLAPNVSGSIEEFNSIYLVTSFRLTSQHKSSLRS